ncbi:hypothetical protein [Halobacillus massiliensis]|uniref:hypothetical protein n=1 Tax=Halobacillus massiliensis TaxID=1926286 RepID=UPI0009E1D280|nr:hypothetical protein [Halobacillus massiliensis]
METKPLSFKAEIKQGHLNALKAMNYVLGAVIGLITGAMLWAFTAEEVEMGAYLGVIILIMAVILFFTLKSGKNQIPVSITQSFEENGLYEKIHWPTKNEEVEEKISYVDMKNVYIGRATRIVSKVRGERVSQTISYPKFVIEWDRDGQTGYKTLISGWHPPINEIIKAIPSHVSLHAIKHNLGAIPDNRMAEALQTIETVPVVKKTPLDLPFKFGNIKFRDLPVWKPSSK